MREVLDVNGTAIRRAVEALNGERRSCQPAEALRQIMDRVDVDQLEGQKKIISGRFVPEKMACGQERRWAQRMA